MRLSLFKKLVLLTEVSGLVIYKKPENPTIEIQLGPFGDPLQPIQTNPTKIKNLDGKYNYKLIPRRSDNHLVLILEVEPSKLEDCMTYLTTDVLIFPDEADKHFTGEGDIRKMILPEKKRFDVTKEAVTVHASPYQFMTD